MDQTVYQFSLPTPSGQDLSLKDFAGNVILVVNIASRCGRAGQLDQLEKIYRDYKDRGLMIIGVPSNDFNQEPLNGAAIGEYCQINHGVTFRISDKVHVKGGNAHPLFQFFADKKINGKIHRTPKWNYYKFLIGRDGKVVDSFYTYRRPASRKVVNAIEREINRT